MALVRYEIAQADVNGLDIDKYVGARVAMLGDDPRALPPYRDWMIRGGSGNFVDRHHTWVFEANFPAKVRAICEHKALSKMLDGLVDWDRFNAPTLLSAEVALRCLHWIEEVHRLDSANQSCEGSSLSMGDEFRRAPSTRIDDTVHTGGISSGQTTAKARGRGRGKGLAPAAEG